MSEKLHLRIINKKITKTFMLKPSEKDSEIKEVQMILNTDVKESAVLIAILMFTMKSDSNLYANAFKEQYKLTDEEYFDIYATFQSLDKRGLISLESSRHRSSVFYPYVEMLLQPAESILNGVGPYHSINSCDPYAWIDRYAALLRQRKDEKISYETYCNILKTDIEHMDDSILAKAELEKMSDIEKSIFMYVMQRFIANKKSAELDDYFRDVMGDDSSSEDQNNVTESSLPLFESGLIHKSTIVKNYDEKEVALFPSVKAQSIYFGEKFVRNKYVNVDFSNINSIFGYFDKLQESLNDSICPAAYFEELKSLTWMIDDKLPIKNYIKKLSDDEINILFFCINEYLNSESGANLSDILDNSYEMKADIKRISDKIENDEMKFLKDGTVEKEMEKSFFSSYLQLTLTSKGIRKLLQINPVIKMGENAMVSVVRTPRKGNSLYFSGELKAEIEVLTNALYAQRYKSLVSSLNKKGFSHGFVCLLYGAPGTGKTAVCKEIARITKRDIVQVDISRIRDMYVGESEKRLKKVFSEYYALKYQMKNTPILLFNEADALIGRRIDVVKSVDQMNNSMQNILLEELEKFDGIFMATTNLVDNLDDAFSRRFLYKINFKNPDAEVRKQIWKKYLPEIDDVTLEHLSSKELSGGQIENIAKKYHVETAIRTGQDISLNEIIHTEMNFKKRENIIGFTG